MASRYCILGKNKFSVGIAQPDRFLIDYCKLVDAVESE